MLNKKELQKQLQITADKQRKKEIREGKARIREINKDADEWLNDAISKIDEKLICAAKNGRNIVEIATLKTGRDLRYIGGDNMPREILEVYSKRIKKLKKLLQEKDFFVFEERYSREGSSLGIVRAYDYLGVRVDISK